MYGLRFERQFSLALLVWAFSSHACGRTRGAAAMNLLASGSGGTKSPECRTVAATVIICAYTLDRWEMTCAAVASVLVQRPAPQQVLLVVDHNDELAALARQELPGITVLPNEGPVGLAGARNTGLQAAAQPIAVFLDDDAEARSGWLASLIEPYSSSLVLATGGSVHPRWSESRPLWMPPEFDWVVGCTYVGMPERGGAIRNPIGANMSLRTEPARIAGGFDTRVGRIGRCPRGCEETELAIRLVARNPGSVVRYVPAAAVDHHVPSERTRLSYFLLRCWHEGLSKADVAQLSGAGPALQREIRQTALVIPKALLRELGRTVAGDHSALLRMAASAGGLTAAVLGFVLGRCRARFTGCGAAGWKRAHRPRP